MNISLPAGELSEASAPDLHNYLALCEELLDLTGEESRALAGPDYQPGRFHQKRKDLLPRFETALIYFRTTRKNLKSNSQTQFQTSPEVKHLFQAIQGAIMRILLLDRENQRAMLGRGLVPADHLPPAAGQQSHYVASIYRRHAAV